VLSVWQVVTAEIEKFLPDKAKEEINKQLLAEIVKFLPDKAKAEINKQLLAEIEMFLPDKAKAEIKKLLPNLSVHVETCLGIRWEHHVRWSPSRWKA
jgi:hypothetical protein